MKNKRADILFSSGLKKKKTPSKAQTVAQHVKKTQKNPKCCKRGWKRLVLVHFDGNNADFQPFLCRVEAFYVACSLTAVCSGCVCTHRNSRAPPPPPFTNQCLTHWLKGLAGEEGGGQSNIPSRDERTGRTKEQGNPSHQPPLVKASSPHCWGRKGHQRKRKHQSLAGQVSPSSREGGGAGREGGGATPTQQNISNNYSTAEILSN